MATPFNLINFPKQGRQARKTAPVFPKIKGLENHLSVCQRIGLDRLSFDAPLAGYCPGRPPKHGALVLTQSHIIFCQKTKLGDAFIEIEMSRVSAFQTSRLLKQTFITIHTAGLNFQFVTRMPQNDIASFMRLLRERSK